MCGIVGYVGKREAKDLLIEGLRRLEYRGYDSAGVALVEGKKLKRVRALGKVAELEKKTDGVPYTATTGIAQTRWATHGKPSEKNAKPHSEWACGLAPGTAVQTPAARSVGDQHTLTATEAGTTRDAQQ